MFDIVSHLPRTYLDSQIFVLSLGLLLCVITRVLPRVIDTIVATVYTLAGDACELSASLFPSDK